MREALRRHPISTPVALGVAVRAGAAIRASRVRDLHEEAIRYIGAKVAHTAILLKALETNLDEDDIFPEDFRLQWANDGGVGDANLRELFSYMCGELLELCVGSCRTLVEFNDDEVIEEG